MHDNLVIVESITKAKTVKRYLGKDYDVVASIGHIRDLPAKRMGVNIENNFDPKYVVLKDKIKVVDELKKKFSKCKRIFLATDPDREGEAISWHLAYILKLDLSNDIRVTFNEITKIGVNNGIKSARKIDLALVESQQTRRILDRLVGYKLSPFLCKKIQKGLSAGRVQSVALKTVVDREKEILIFQPEEYWSVDAKFLAKYGEDKICFDSNLVKIKNENVEIKNENEAMNVLEEIKKEKYEINKVIRSERKKKPFPPFITSKMQQEAFNKLGFSSKRTMKIAQELYEGINLREIGITGLITYMRTDSLRVSDEAIQKSRDFIIKNLGKDYVPEIKRIFKSKKSSQDAHEAIRPTDCLLIPEKIKNCLTIEQFKLYDLIWRRFISSQMSDCVYDTIKIEVKSDSFVFRTFGSGIKFDGFLALYNGDKKEEGIKNELLKLSKGMECVLLSLNPEQHFTSPPPRFTEASLIKFLEENDVGRPSTYSSTMSTITYRDYVIKEEKTFKPTELGFKVSELLEKYFSEIVNVEFTAELESKLDSIEVGKEQRFNVLKDFYSNFELKLNEAQKQTKNLKIEIKENVTDVLCDKCGKNMLVKKSRYGKFMACSGFPECRNTKKFAKKIGVDCPKCGGDIVKSLSSKGRLFYGCSQYPSCNFVSWALPTNKKCINCNEMLFYSNKKVICNKCNSQEKE